MRSAAAHVAAGAAPTSSTSTWAARCRRSARPARAPRCSTTPTRAVAVARAARRGQRACRSRSSCAPAGARASTSGFELAHRLVDEAGVAAIAFHPRSRRRSSTRACPTTTSPPSWSRALPRAGDPHRRPAHDAERVRDAFEHTGAAAVMLARGVARQPVAVRAAARRAATASPTREEVLAELDWVIDRAVEHLGEPSAPAATCASSTPGTWSALGGAQGSCRTRCSSADDRRRARRCWRARHALALGAPERPGRVAILPRSLTPIGRDRPLTAGFLHSVQPTAIESHAQGRHPHPRRPREAQGRARAPLRPSSRREVAERIKEAREFGDISENSEYDDAKNEQAMLEAQIAAARGEAARGARSIDAKDALHRRRRRRLDRPRQGREDRQVASSTRSSARPRPTRPSTSSPTSRRSARRCSATSATRSSPCRCPRGPARKLKITKIDVGLEARRAWRPDDDARRRRRRRPARAARRAPRQARAPARGGHRPVPARLPGRRADRRRARRARRTSRPARRPTRAYRVAGRLAARRGQGKMAFLDLVDRSGRIQLQARARRARRGALRARCSTSTSAT